MITSMNLNINNPWGSQIPHAKTKKIMSEEKKPTERIRKNYSRKEVSQKMMAFRIDYENLEWLQQFQNKGRYINELIAADRVKKEG